MKESELVSADFGVCQKSVSFSGLKNPDSPCLFVFDLDGTLADGSTDEIKKVFNIAAQRNARVVFATGRNLDEFESLRKNLEEKNFDSFLPDYLVANNGGNIYAKYDNELRKDFNYAQSICSVTNFDRKSVIQSLEIFNNKMTRIDNDEENTLVLKYNVSVQTDLKRLRKDVLNFLAQKDIKVLCGYSGEGTDNQKLFLAPFNKARGLYYIKQKLNIPDNEILIAGNDNNDISMAQMSEFGSKFICLNNSVMNLKNVCKDLKEKFGNIYFSVQNGTKGIVEGMDYFFKN